MSYFDKFFFTNFNWSNYFYFTTIDSFIWTNLSSTKSKSNFSRFVKKFWRKKKILSKKNLLESRIGKEESRVEMKENHLGNKSMILLDYPRLFSSSPSSSPTELDHSRQESIHFPNSSDDPQQTNPLYTDLTPVINSTPLPSFETLNSKIFLSLNINKSFLF